MKTGIRGAVCAGAIILWASTSVGAAPGVPTLNAEPADYVGYAVDALPDHFRTAEVNALDNTPADNPITNAGAELGRVLFYDTRLSHNNSTSCASCHTQETGFADAEQFSVGFEGGLTGRHSMGLSNARWYARGRFFWDERAETLEDQVLGPIQDAVEMGSDLSSLTAELNDTAYYPVLFERAFGDGEVTSDRMSRALAQFVRSMASYQSPYDQAVEAGSSESPDFAAVAAIENADQVAQGHAVFQGSCASCHATDTHSSDTTHNIGLPIIDADGDGQPDVDAGARNGRFKSPSLRNIAIRGRFMHDGRFQTLEEVIEFYSSGVVRNGFPLARGVEEGGFGFTEEEKDALLAFLETLTDVAFLSSDLFSDPMSVLRGDLNGDGLVDAADLTAWANAYGETDTDVSGPLFADANGDGVVDAADYTAARDNLGAAWNDNWAAFAEAVPEPASVLIVALAATAAGGRRRGRRIGSGYSPYSSM